MQLCRRTRAGKLQNFGRFGEGICLGLTEILMHQSSFDLDAKVIDALYADCFSREEFSYYLDQLPFAVQNFLRALAQLAHVYEEHLKHLLHKGLSEQVAAVLLRQSDNQNPRNEGDLSLAITNDEIAAYIGRTPEAVSKFICHLRRRGMIERENGFIFVRDRQCLAERFGSDL